MSTQEVVVNLKIDTTRFDEQVKQIEKTIETMTLRARLAGISFQPPEISFPVLCDARVLKKVLADIHGKPVVNSVNEEIGQVTDARMTPGGNVVADISEYLGKESVAPSHVYLTVCTCDALSCVRTTR